jgi:hypothetical protein
MMARWLIQIVAVALAAVLLIVDPHSTLTWICVAGAVVSVVAKALSPKEVQR